MRDYSLHEKHLLFILLTLIFAFGFLVKIYQLGSIPPGLYTDELVGILRAKIQLFGKQGPGFRYI